MGTIVETQTPPATGNLSLANEERLRTLIDSVLAFIGVVSLDGTLLEANEPAVQASGLPRSELIGRPFWECYWWAHDEALQEQLRDAVRRAAAGEVVRYDAYIRIAGEGRLWIDFQLVPVRDERGNVVELIPSGVDISERKQAEAHRELLLNELSHRVKNTLASIQSMAGQTLRGAESPDEFRHTFSARLRAIAASHDLLVEANHESVRLMDLIRQQVAPFAADDERLVLSGKDLTLRGDLAHSLGLILHELATNAAKYGAFSTRGGRVSIEWTVEDGERRVLRFAWTERGGPSVQPPSRRGFGTRLIEHTMGADAAGGAAFDFAPEGLGVRMTVPL